METVSTVGKKGCACVRAWPARVCVCVCVGERERERESVTRAFSVTKDKLGGRGIRVGVWGGGCN